GGLVTALLGMARHVDAVWVASAQSEADRDWGQGRLPVSEGDTSEAHIRVRFIKPDPAAYDGYYNVISNPLLWFLQHSMWDFGRAPNINLSTWQAWEDYRTVNRLFAETISDEIMQSERPSLVMLQDYQLYLAPYFIRQKVRSSRKYTLAHFIHIPWPGAEAWGLLPAKMRLSILEGLCAVDLLCFQNREDGMNFIRTCDSYLPRAHIKYRYGRIWYRNHATHVRDFPISIDVQDLQHVAASDEVTAHRQHFEQRFGSRQLIVRVDRTEPSKNIVRGFQAFDEMLDLHPEHHDKVQFLALLVPSRMAVEEYKDYLDELMAAAGRVNVKHGTSEWEPVRVIVGENYPRAVAALQIYDVLLVNSIADGMNLVAKEGPVVNRCSGVVVLSERTGARQQLEPGALVISPCDVYATAEALHQALTLPQQTRSEYAERLRRLVEHEDITDWLCRQLEEIRDLGL
ncbi:MAG TPA: trehalose-6-phosphate synthase, partial [Anaerolineaceae bacterium]